jgi:DUF4097 and DUF4098 domain-containing protein YvlB
MVTDRFLVRCSLLTALVTAATPALAAEKTLDRTFKVAAGGRLDVTAEVADIEVNSGSNTEVVVRIVMTGAQDALDAITLNAEQKDNNVAVTALTKERRSERGRLEGRITVQVPPQYDVELKTSGGDLTVARLQGTTSGKTSGGDIRLTELRGPVKMSTSGGDITVSATQGKVEVQTSGGDITAKNIEGDLDARTSGGNIEVENVAGTTRAATSGGNVAARGARGDTRLQTSGGNIAADVTGKIDAKSSAGDIRVQLNGPNQGISATTSGGNIELQLPRDIKATVDASTSGGTVRSDLATDATQKTPQKLTGSINGGGETVYARTSGGSVRLVERGTSQK